MVEKKFEVAGNVSIVSTGKSTVHKEQFEKTVDDAVKAVNPGAGVSLDEMYDRFSKLEYVIDASGSMGEGLLNADSVKQYKWTPELLLAFRAAMKEDPDLVDEIEEWDDENDCEKLTEQHIDVDAMSDEDLKRTIVFDSLQNKYPNIDLPMNYSYRSRGRSKMMALKDAAKSFVRTRFERFADARVAVFQFEDQPQLLCKAGASEAEVLAAIQRLPDNGGGGTNIYRAVDRAVNECQKRPSEVGLHHIVLVSDGCDYGALRVEEMIPKMKELGIVFDFIYMLGASPDQQGEAVAKVMQKVCEATGGEYTVVKTEEDFVQKFLEVSKRPMLPAPK